MMETHPGAGGSNLLKTKSLGLKQPAADTSLGG